MDIEVENENVAEFVTISSAADEAGELNFDEGNIGEQTIDEIVFLHYLQTENLRERECLPETVHVSTPDLSLQSTSEPGSYPQGTTEELVGSQTFLKESFEKINEISERVHEPLSEFERSCSPICCETLMTSTKAELTNIAGKIADNPENAPATLRVETVSTSKNVEQSSDLGVNSTNALAYDEHTRDMFKAIKAAENSGVCDKMTEKFSLEAQQIINKENNLEIGSGDILVRASSECSSNEGSSSVLSTSSLRGNDSFNSFKSSAKNSNKEDSYPPLPVKKRKNRIFDDPEDNEKPEFEHADKKIRSASVFVHQTCDVDEDDSHRSLSGASKKISNVSDFEMMLHKKREERQKSRKRGVCFINTDLIDQLVDRMEEAAYEDRQLNKKGLPAIKKVSMLKYSMSQLRKKYLQSIFLEHNILGTLTEWLSPLPNKCLPCLQIRENILRLLDDFPPIDASLIRQSGIGRMLKFLREHPEESKENKDRCNQLIFKWTHPMYGTSGEYRAMTKRERQERDYELSLKYSKQKSQVSSHCKKNMANLLDMKMSNGNKFEAKHPGEPGWVPRARVPQISIRDYIIRPVPKFECDIQMKSRPSRFEVLNKKYQRTKRNELTTRGGAKLSIVGDKM